MTDLLGTTLGQYQIVELIGEGGMASVYKAWQPSLRRYVALKVLAPHLAGDAEFVQRFHQEAVSAANLKQSNIVIIHDVGSESGYHYIAMEFIEGASLEQRIRAGQRFTPEQVVDILSQIGAALDYAHQRGFIHRDIKPANILIEASGRAVLTDFGIVKALSGSGVTSALTRAGTVFGTPEYMSPEQIRDEPLDHRADLYALGIVCYEMLAGKVPFDGTTTHAVLYAQVNNPPPPLRDVAGLALPPAVEAVVDKLLAKERQNRYGSAGEFARDLAQAVSGVWPAGMRGQTVVAGPERTARIGETPGVMPERTVPMGETPAGAGAAPVTQPAQPSWTPTPEPWTPTPPPMPAQPPAPARRRRWPLVLGITAAAIGAVLIVGAVIGVLLLDMDNPLETVQAMLDLRSAQTALDDGDYAEAADKFSLVLDNAPDNEEALDGQLEAAEKLAQDEQFNAAIAAYESIWEAKPGEVQALRGLGQAYEDKGDWGEAANWYEKWAQAEPDNGEAFLALGNARYNLGEIEQAVAEYERAEELGTTAPEFDARLGLAYFGMAQYDKAAERLPRAVDQNPEDFPLQRALGVSLYALGQPQQALEHLNSAVELGAGQPGEELADVYYALGGSYFALQDYEHAIGSYQQAQQLDPEGQAIWAGEAQANLEQAYPKLAQQVMQQAMLDLDFSNVVTEGEETYAVARTGQRARIEGAVHLVDGPREGPQALVVEEGTNNLIPNPSLEAGIVGWASPYGDATISQSESEAIFGSACGKLVGATNYAFSRARYGGIPVTAGTTYAFSSYIKDGAGGSGKSVLLALKGDSSGETTGSFTVTDEWQRMLVLKTTDPSDTRLDVAIVVAEDVSGFALLFDGVQLEAKSHATSYVDGSLGKGYSWAAQAHASTSTREATEINLDEYVDLLSGNDTLSFRVVVQMPHGSDDENWPVAVSHILDARQDGDTGRLTLAYNTGDDKFYVFGPSTATVVSSSPQTFSAGDWLDIVATLDYSADSYKLYIDGESVGSGSGSYSASVLTDWTLGKYSLGSSTWGGYAFGEHAVFDRVLTAVEAAALHGVDASATR